jgi:glutathione S-transferase
MEGCMQIVIGDKNLSSWSLRPWLALKRTGAPFEEILVRLNREDTTQAILEHSPTAMVPALKTDAGETLWDTLAISEWLAERYPEARLWPADPTARAMARSAAAEMHSGFASLRGECPMNLKLRIVSDVSPPTRANLRRLAELFTLLRTRFADRGPFLVGDWSIADAFYTPVATRIRSYGLKLSDYGDTGPADRYVETLLQQPDFLDWERAALADPEAEA